MFFFVQFYSIDYFFLLNLYSIEIIFDLWKIILIYGKIF